MNHLKMVVAKIHAHHPNILLMEKQFGSYTLVSDVLFDLLCDMGKLTEAELCFLQMLGKGRKPSDVLFRRIKILIELANRHEALQRTERKMSAWQLQA